MVRPFHCVNSPASLAGAELAELTAGAADVVAAGVAAAGVAVGLALVAGCWGYWKNGIVFSAAEEAVDEAGPLEPAAAGELGGTVRVTRY